MYKEDKCPTGIGQDSQHDSSTGKCKSKLQGDATSHLLGWLLSKKEKASARVHVRN